MNMKKMLSLVLVSAMTLTMAATAFAEEAGGLSGANCDPANTAKTDETLTIGFGSEPSTLVGTATGNTENESMMIFSALTDNLVAYNSLTGEIEPQLATAWEWVDDKHCKFTLRDDVTMSDGTPFVADDVVFSVKMWRDQNATNETGSIFTECADPVADDEHTVTIEFTSNAPDIIRMLTWTNYGIVSEDEVNAAGGFEEVGKNPLVGSGPYKFVSWTNGQNIVIERNEEYWNQDYAGYYKQIVFTFTSDPAARIMAVQSGDADVAYAIPTAQASTFQGNEAVKVVNYTFDQVNHLWFNMGENAGATADQKVREAIDKALDYRIDRCHYAVAVLRLIILGAAARDCISVTVCRPYRPSLDSCQHGIVFIFKSGSSDIISIDPAQYLGCKSSVRIVPCHFRLDGDLTPPLFLGFLNLLSGQALRDQNEVLI